jgi:hypothetical protein
MENEKLDYKSRLTTKTSFFSIFDTLKKSDVIVKIKMYMPNFETIY